MPKIIPNLWFDNQALEAAEYYCSIFPNSQVKEVTNYTQAGPGEPGSILTVEFLLDGQPFVAINGGPHEPYTDALSLQIDCDDQEEVDYYWNRLTANGGEPVQCGWLKDRYRVPWQVVPEEMTRLISDADRERADRVMKAMMQMTKIDIGALRAAADGGDGAKPGGVASVVKKMTAKLTGKKTAPTSVGREAADAVTSAAGSTTKSVAKKAGAAKKTVAKKTGAAKRTAAKKTGAAKKTVAKKTVAKKAGAAKKTAAKKTSAAKKTVAKKTSAAKKSAARR
jgi:predicted 3-demethylubiquinone-9 3-methyltransferase (glyoxalase superfamily)